jgi:hypothetical protein
MQSKGQRETRVPNLITVVIKVTMPMWNSQAYRSIRSKFGANRTVKEHLKRRQLVNNHSGIIVFSIAQFDTSRRFSSKGTVPSHLSTFFFGWLCKVTTQLSSNIQTNFNTKHLKVEVVFDPPRKYIGNERLSKQISIVPFRGGVLLHFSINY